MLKKIIVVAVVAFGCYQWSHGSRIGLDSPLSSAVSFSQREIRIDHPPLQQAISKTGLAFQFKDYTIQPLASFQVKARVLGSKHYRLGREAELSPVDLALGWGPMARDEVLEALDISQSNRFSYWRAQQLPIPRRDIETNSTNLHTIPASAEIDQRLRRIDEGDIILLKGYLVRIEASDGWNWASSLTRDDTGKGACELVLVESIL